MILCCGEALIDMIPTPTQSGCDGFVPCSGGAVFNTSIALGRLGIQTGMLTGLSSDIFGQQLRADLHASQVNTSQVILSDRPTTLAFVHLTDGNASYSFFDENSAGRMIGPSDLKILPDEITALYLGGISLACEPSADAYAAFATAHHANRVVMLDPNIRPGFIRDIDRFRARQMRLFSVADIVKVSDEDLNWIFPGPEALASKVVRLREAGPSVILLTRGEEGATAFLRDGTQVSVPSRKVTVIDTVGAGDTFNAGFLARLSELGTLSKAGLKSVLPETFEEALRFGADTAAITVSRAGANPPWRHEL